MFQQGSLADYQIVRVSTAYMVSWLDWAYTHCPGIKPAFLSNKGNKEVFGNSFIRKKVENATTQRKDVKSKYVCALAFHTNVCQYGLKVCVYGGRKREFFQLRTKENTMQEAVV